MISILAQASAAMPPSVSTTTILVGLAALLAAARIFYILDGDLDDSQVVLKDPYRFAVKTSLTYDDLKDNNWKAFRALLAASRLQDYMRSFGWCLRRESGFRNCLVFVALFIILFIYAGKVAPSSGAQDLVIKAGAVLIGIWLVLIEIAKSKKKAVELLRVASNQGVARMFCGFNTKMVQGLALFAEGLFEATLDRSREQKIDIQQAFKAELKDITAFLEGIERLHQETKRKFDRATSVKTITHWMAEHDR